MLECEGKYTILSHNDRAVARDQLHVQLLDIGQAATGDGELLARSEHNGRSAKAFNNLKVDHTAVHADKAVRFERGLDYARLNRHDIY